MAKGKRGTKKSAKAQPGCHWKSAHQRHGVTYRCVHKESGRYHKRENCGIPDEFTDKKGRKHKHIPAYGENLRDKRLMAELTAWLKRLKVKKGYELQWVRIGGSTHQRCMCDKKFANENRCR